LNYDTFNISSLFKTLFLFHLFSEKKSHTAIYGSYAAKMADYDRNKVSDEEIHHQTQVTRYSGVLMRSRDILKTHANDWRNALRPTGPGASVEEEQAYQDRRYYWDVARVDVLWQYARHHFSELELEAIHYCRLNMDRPTPYFVHLLKQRFVEQKLLNVKGRIREEASGKV
jgi:hypothetical protein